MADGWGGAPAQFCPGRETLKIELDSGRHRHIGAMVRGCLSTHTTHTHTHTHKQKQNNQSKQSTTKNALRVGGPTLSCGLKHLRVPCTCAGRRVKDYRDNVLP
jgi:hypothetical protein